MPRYVAFLRAINVGGARTVKMTTLCQAFEAMDFGEVSSYIASGNIIFTSRTLDAEESLRIGLLNRIAPAETLVDEAVAYADLMTQWPPMALRMSKRVLQHNTDAEIEAALRYETVGLSFARKAPNDVKESRAAFVEKRKGVYTGA